MNLLRAAGLVEDAPADLATRSPEASARLLSEAVDFLRAGGTVSLADWRDLSEPEKAALVEAGNVVATERAVAVGLAAQSPRAAAEVARPVDGGDAARTMTLEAMTRAVAAKVPTEPSVGVGA